MSYLNGHNYKQFCKDGLQGTIETYCALHFVKFIDKTSSLEI